MSVLKIIVTVIYCIVAIAFTASVLMQEGKSAGLGAIGAIIFFVGAILLNMNF